MGTRFLAICLIAGLLAACTGGHGDPSTSPSPLPTTATTSPPPTSVSATPTRTGPLTTGPNVRPGEKPPVFPELAKRRTSIGATVAGAYYFKALDWSIASNDDWLIQRLALPSCAACNRVHLGIASLRTKRTIEKGGRIRVRSAVVEHRERGASSDFAVRVTYDEDAVTLLESDGTSRVTQKAVVGVLALVLLRWVNGGWRVVDVTSA